MAPPAAVCILAIVSTVGAAVAFKHFVYDPHLSHVVRRWKEELVQWRRRPHRGGDEPEVPMQEREESSRVNLPDDTALSSRWETSRNGSAGRLLSRSRLRDLLQEEENLPLSSIELDNLVARELFEWRNEAATSSGQDLRQRNVSSSASRQDAYHDSGGLSHPLELEEDTRPLPFVPLSPRRTHVVYNSGSASPTSNLPDGLPSPPLTTTSIPATLPSLPSPSNNTTASPLIGSPLSGSITGSQGALLRRPLMHNQPVLPNLGRNLETSASPPPIISLPHDSQLPLPPNAISLFSHDSSPTRGFVSAPSQEQEHNSPFLLSIPSLSQSYPQELEVEHGLEFLSPPSSRSDSPFSMANMSPHPPALTPYGNTDSHRPTVSPLLIEDVGPLWEMFSPSISLGLGLGNESYDTLSPAVGPRQLASRAASGPGSGIYPTSSVTSGLAGASPFFNEVDGSATPHSVTSSLKSSEYLSFTESERGNEDDDDDVPLAARRASLISAISGHFNTTHTSASERLGHGQGLGLTFVPSPVNLPAPLSPSMLSPRSRLAEVSTSGYGVHPSIGPISDTSDLSDLDLMSDYNALSELGEIVSYPGSANGSESGRANGEGGRLHSPLRTATIPAPGSHSGHVTNESDHGSDASWSIAGGSDFGDDEAFPDREPQTPQLRPVRKTGDLLRRDDTIRGQKKL